MSVCQCRPYGWWLHLHAHVSKHTESTVRQTAISSIQLPWACLDAFHNGIIVLKRLCPEATHLSEPGMAFPGSSYTCRLPMEGSCRPFLSQASSRYTQCNSGFPVAEVRLTYSRACHIIQPVHGEQELATAATEYIGLDWARYAYDIPAAPCTFRTSLD